MRYFAVERHAANEISQIYPYPECDRNNPDLCYWVTERLSSIDIVITNCGNFYVYFLQPTASEPFKREAFSLSLNPDPPRAPVYCTSTESINRGNGYRETFFPFSEIMQ